MASCSIADGHKIDVERLLETRALIQASSGFGKSWALRRLLEQTAPKVQQLVIDPEGEFATLREQFDYVICAPHDADAIATPRTAALLARRLLETGVSAILNIYDLKTHERQAFVKTFLTTLVNAPKALWRPVLIVLDEAHMFAPEKGGSESTEAVVDLASRGRKRGQCLIAATQRLAKLHKDVAAEMLNKMIGRCGLDIDIRRAADELGMTPKEATEHFRTFNPGDFFIFGPALSPTVERVAVGKVATTHPKAGSRLMEAPPAASAKIKGLIAAELADLPQQAEVEIRTFEDAKREVSNLRRQLTLAEKAQPVAAGPKVDVKPYLKQIERLRAAVETLMKFVIEINAKDFAAKADVDEAAMTAAVSAAVDRATKLIEQKLDARNREVTALQSEGKRLIERIKKLAEIDDVSVAVSVTHNEPFTVAPRPAPRTNGHAAPYDGPLGKGERACLIAIAQHDEGVDREQITILTGYKRSTRDAYVQRLQAAGLVDVGNVITATEGGFAALPPDFEPLPKGDDLRAHWLQRLPVGERAVFEVLIEAYPNAVSRDEITDRTSYKRSTRDAYIQRLGLRKLVNAERGEVSASAFLFGV